MKKYFCSLCGYVYRPSKGDLFNNIPPNTSFADLLDSWNCPNCSVAKKAFKSCEREAMESGRQNMVIGEEINDCSFPDKKMKKAG